MRYLKLMMCVMMIAGLSAFGCGGGDENNGGGGDGATTTDGGGTQCVAADGDCTSGTCCAGLTCNADKKCEAGTDCVVKGGDCSAVACCANLSCNTTTKVCEESSTCIKVGDECEADEDCCAATETGKGMWCNAESVCATCSKKDATCTTDYDCCPTTSATDVPLMCTTAGKCAPICKKTSECTAPMVCMPNGECVAPSCSSDAECNGKKCCSGDCKDDCGYGSPTACKIVSKGGVIYTGKSIQLYAVAYKGDPKTGGQIIPWTAFTWSSDAATKVAVDTAGKITGGATEGKAVINAKAGSTDCGTVDYVNYLAISSGVRVVVLDESTGLPVANADVIVGANAAVKTDASGVAAVASGAAADGIHVFAANYAWVSVVGAGKTDYVIHLVPKPDTAKAGGFKGPFDFTNVKDDAIQLGLAGNSITGNLLDLDFMMLIGEMILTHLKLETAKGAPVDYDDWMGLPGAIVLHGKQFGVPDLINDFRILGTSGLRTAWGIGGGLPSKDITKLISLLAPIIGGGGDIPIGQIVAAVIPLFNKFSHAVQSVVDVVPIDKIATPCMNTKTAVVDATDTYPCTKADNQPMVDSAKMANYDSFPKLTLKLVTKMALATTLTLPDLPKYQTHCMTGLAILGGVYLPEMGMIPLGIGVGLDNPADPTVEGDCKVTPDPSNNPEGLTDGQTMLHMSTSHNGTEGNPYLIVQMALDFNSLTSGSIAISGRVKMVNKIDSTYNMTSEKLLGFAEGSMYTSATRTITGPTAAVAGANLYRYKVNTSDGDWYVYTASHNTPITLPAVPGGYADRAASAEMSAHAISLAGTTIDKLVAADNGQHLNNLFDVVDAFSHLSCLKKLDPTDPKCTTADPTQKDAACNPPCEFK